MSQRLPDLQGDEPATEPQPAAGQPDNLELAQIQALASNLLWYQQASEIPTKASPQETPRGSREIGETHYHYSYYYYYY